MSDEVSAKPKMSAFSAIRSAFDDLGMYDDLVLDVPTQHDLCRCDSVTAGDLYEPRVAQVDVQQRAVTLQLHSAAPMRLEHVRIEERWAPLDLVDSR